MGIGGEYAAINSAIDELIPARVRGVVDLTINGSYWLGTALGAVMNSVLLDPRVLGHAWGFRAAFGLGAVLALGDRAGAPLRARVAALADGPRRATPRRWRSSPRSRRVRAPSTPRGAAAAHPIHVGEHVGLGRVARVDVPAVPLARDPRPRADDRAGVLLQRDLLHLRADADAVLRRRRRSTSAHYLLPFALGNFSARWCSAGRSTSSAGGR